MNKLTFDQDIYDKGIQGYFDSMPSDLLEDFVVLRDHVINADSTDEIMQLWKSHKTIIDQLASCLTYMEFYKSQGAMDPSNGITKEYFAKMAPKFCMHAALQLGLRRNLLFFDKESGGAWEFPVGTPRHNCEALTMYKEKYPSDFELIRDDFEEGSEPDACAYILACMVNDILAERGLR